MISIRDSENCLRDILSFYQNVTTVLPNKKTPLRNALDFNRLRSGSVLIEMGANVHECEDGYQELSLVYYAIRQNQPKFLNLLLSHMTKEEVQSYADMRYPEGNTLLHVATRYANQDMVCLLLDKGFNPNTPNEKGETPLHWAAASNNLKIVYPFFRNKTPILSDPTLKTNKRERITSFSSNGIVRSCLYKQRYKHVIARKMIPFTTRRYQWLTKKALHRANGLFARVWKERA